MLQKRDDLKGENCERNALPHVQLPRTECLESIFCHFCLLTLLLLIEHVQSGMTVSVLIICTHDERGHYVFDTHLFSMFWVKHLFELLELKVVFRNLFCRVYFGHEKHLPQDPRVTHLSY